MKEMNIRELGATREQENHVWAHGYRGSGLSVEILEQVAEMQRFMLSNLAQQLYELRQLHLTRGLQSINLDEVLLLMHKLATKAGA